MCVPLVVAFCETLSTGNPPGSAVDLLFAYNIHDYDNDDDDDRTISRLGSQRNKTARVPVCVCVSVDTFERLSTYAENRFNAKI